MIENRRGHLIRELFKVYKIEKVDKGEFAIRGIELPTDLK